MEYYGNNDYRNYLSHHGVLGMHWGIRRYQPYGTGYKREGGAGGKEVGEARGTKASKPKKTTGIIKRMGIRIRARGAKKMRNFMNFRNARGFNRKASALIGNKRHESTARIDSQKESKLADASKTRIWKRIHETRSANRAHMADYYAKKQKQSVGRRIFERAIVNPTYLKTPYQRLSGRKTTIGKELLNRAFTGGIAGAVLDAKHLRAKSKTSEAVSARKAAKEQKYQNKINKINEKGSKTIKSINAARSKSLSSIKANYDKKISKAKDPGKKAELKAAKNAAIKDFNAGTNYINKAHKNTMSNRTQYLDMKRKAVTDKSVKKSADYAEAKKKARSQRVSDLVYGKKGALISESMNIARTEQDKKKKKS